MKLTENQKIYGKRYRESLHGYLGAMFSRIKDRLKYSPSYAGKTLDFTFKEFKDFIDGGLLKTMLDSYLASGKNQSLAPSIDRIDNRKGYSLDNIRLITKGENSRKGAKYESPAHTKKIKQLTRDLKIVKAWDSAKEVYLTLGYDRSSLCSCLKGRSNTSYGYKWQYDSSTDTKHTEGGI